MAAVALLCICALGQAGCGDGEAPTREVARTGDVVFGQEDVEAYISGTLVSEGQDPARFKPPHYAGCVRQKTQAHEPRPRRQCAIEYRLRQAQAVRSLIRAEWFAREARRRHLTPDVAAARAVFAAQSRNFEAQKRRYGLAGETYERFLRKAGFSKEEMMRRLRAAQQEQQVTNAVPVSEASIRSYYEHNRNEFGDPAQRTLRLLRVGTSADGQAARRALVGGASWKQVAKRFGVAGGDARPVTVVDGYGADPRLGRSIFAAPAHRLSGPLRTGTGTFLFEVEQVIPPARTSLARNRPAIMLLLRSRVRDEQLRRRYGPDTTCAPRYRIPEVPECQPLAE